MRSLLLSVHVLAVALWFGSVVFFTIAGLLIFNAFNDLSTLPAQQRPVWFPVPDAFTQSSLGEGFPEPLRKEQGSRAAGVAVSRIFPVYYALQAVCGVVALGAALVIGNSSSLHRLRMVFLILALATALGGWWLEHRVSDLRHPRNDLTDQVLLAESPSPDLLTSARTARSEFGRWHGYSLLQNFATLLFVTGSVLLIPSLSVPPSASRG